MNKKVIYDIWELQEEVEKRINKKFSDTSYRSLLRFLFSNSDQSNGEIMYYWPDYLLPDDEKEDTTHLSPLEIEIYKALNSICMKEEIKECINIHCWW